MGAAIALVLVLTSFPGSRTSPSPLAQSFTMHGAAICDPNLSCSGITSSRGTVLSFRWSTPAWTWFASVYCSGSSLLPWAEQVPYEANGTGGSSSFLSLRGGYEFGSLRVMTCITANVTGNYTGP